MKDEAANGDVAPREILLHPRSVSIRVQSVFYPWLAFPVTLISPFSPRSGAGARH